MKTEDVKYPEVTVEWMELLIEGAYLAGFEPKDETTDIIELYSEACDYLTDLNKEA